MDFSPIAVGFIWKYSERNTDRHCCPTPPSWNSWNGKIEVHIVSESVGGDSTIYKARFRDSLYARISPSSVPLPDSAREFDFVIKESNGGSLEVITPYYSAFLTKMFREHTFPDAIVLDSQYRSREMKITNQGTAYYGNEIGLLECWDGFNGFFYLDEFNNTTYPLGIIPHRNGIRGGGSEIRGLYSHGKAISVLGRQIR